jgi:tRNA pseudouridine13 synthase
MSETAQQGKRPHPDDGGEPAPKRSRAASQEGNTSAIQSPVETIQPVSRLGLKPQPPVLPASLELATGTKADLSARKGFVGEPEVGILAYLGDPDYTGIQGVIKQR